MKTLTKFANAKINLGLQVLNKRTDGFHNINTFFVPISLSDELIIEESSDYALSCDVEFGIPLEKNLAIIAAKLFNHYANTNHKVKLNLKKNIPHGAGLGGGSSDAAAVLLGMNELFETGLSGEELATIGLQIGSDVPFFIYNKPAIARGRGEQFDFKDFKNECVLLLVFPNINIPTADAYKALNRKTEPIEEIDFYKAIATCDIDVYNQVIVNDFEEYAVRAYPPIGEIKQKLLDNGSIFALMSGSGSCVFGLFECRENAEKASAFFEEYKTFVCNFI